MDIIMLFSANMVDPYPFPSNLDEDGSIELSQKKIFQWMMRTENPEIDEKSVKKKSQIRKLFIASICYGHG